MESPEFTSKLGTGKWIGTVYVLDVCPVCGGIETFKATGKGMWGCTKCKKGGKDIASLRDYFSKNEMMVNYVSGLKEPEPPEDAIVVSQYRNKYQGAVIGTGFSNIDVMLGGLTEGALTIITGKRAEGKSCFIGNLALNAINTNHKVCFYSGELSAGRFQSWLFGQAAGSKHMYSVTDQFGATRWLLSENAEEKIREWLSDKLVLYDNTKAKSSERRTILKCFNKARAYYGCDLFFVDNLMTAKYDIDNDNDALRAQANFAAEMMDFARQNNVHVVLVAHPKKGEPDDINDFVAGFADVTNMATNVLMIKRVLTDMDKKNHPCDSLVIVSKNREYGETGIIEFNFDIKSRRFIPLYGRTIEQYGWEKL